MGLENKFLRTRVHTIQEGWDLCCAVMRKGYEGVQNDSSRYNDLALKFAFRKMGYCYVGVWGWSLHISDVHDKRGRKCLKEVGKEMFIRELGLRVEKVKLPRELIG